MPNINSGAPVDEKTEDIGSFCPHSNLVRGVAVRQLRGIGIAKFEESAHDEVDVNPCGKRC